jgi:hypothetical protein
MYTISMRIVFFGTTKITALCFFWKRNPQMTSYCAQVLCKKTVSLFEAHVKSSPVLNFSTTNLKPSVRTQIYFFEQGPIYM